MDSINNIGNQDTYKKTTYVKSLKKALDILEYFTEENPEWGISDLSRVTGLYKSNIYNILLTFELSGYIQKNNQNGKYRLGFKFLDKSYIVSRHLTDTEIIHEALLDLSRDIPETIYYAILSQNSAIYLDAVFPSPSRFMPFVNGITAPLYCTGLGKALLSMCEDSFIKSVMLESDIKRFTDTTITDYEEMKKEIAITRKRGYSIDNMEHEYGVKCVSVPILDRKGNLNGAISASGPSLRFTDDIIEKYAELLIKTASELKNKL